MPSPPTRSPYRKAARHLLRDTILDATRQQLTEKPWNSVTMADVAASAGISRQTLYKEFASRQGLAAGYLLRLVDTFLEGVAHEITANPGDAHAAITAAFAGFFSAGSGDPMIRNIIGDRPPHDLLSLVTTDGTPILEHATDRLTDIFTGSWTRMSRHHAELFGSTIVRLAISHMTLTLEDPELIAANLSELFSPFLESAIGTEPNS